MQKQTGIPQEALVETPVPPEGKYIYGLFWELSGNRINNCGISYGELKDFMEVTDTELDWWEISAIKTLDGKYLELVAEYNRKRG